MYCATCRGEFREGIVECPICHEPLSAELPEPPAAAVVLRLPTAAALAMVGTAVMFLIRTVGSFHVSQNLIVVRTVMIALFMSYATIIGFFAVFLMEAVTETQRRLRVATWVALVGCVAAALIVALNGLLLFDRPLVSGHQLGIASGVASLLIPVTSVLFFAALWAENGTAPPRLAKAVKPALIGAILSAAAHAVAFGITGLSPGGPPADTHIIVRLIGFPIVVFAVGTWLYFLFVITES